MCKPALHGARSLNRYAAALREIRRVQIFAISGSLRAESANTALLRAIRRLAPDGVAIDLFDALEQMPPFNPDCETEAAPSSVAALRAHLKACDAFLVSTPEYAHGVPGVLKNALDWVVGSGELYEKPVAILQTSAERGQFALASLKETLAVIGTRLVCEVTLLPPQAGEESHLAQFISALVNEVQKALQRGM